MVEAHQLPQKIKACCYEPTEKLGTGGMGEVWKAKHGMLERPAAIKFIKPDSLGLDNADEVERALRQFEREAQATAALTSPHTIELYDFGVSEDSRFYYVMELLDGINLGTLVEDYGSIPADRAIHFLTQACHSLSEAHANGLIHRDVKPANIYTCRRGLDYDFIKVLDFGLVRKVNDSQSDDFAIAGTPAFLAPEIILGNAVDGRVDIYGLGCVAYWLVSGRLVFEGDSAREIIDKHAHQEPPSLCDRTEMDVPEEYERLVLRCLQKNPEERPQSTRDLSLALHECAAVTGNWTQERAEYWWNLHQPLDSRMAK